ncbi:conserved hypothetical protein [Methylocella tundrae]|uniref:Tyr recombinase domain-containing protein n=1 Tax=Methylocella tundrae TaxID=227605 RepID=A0A8B6M586_METTU|nr:tyrosine-type recombinase/integrase [Methylocella tundrae]VTZ26100.1 conserved hypothetical protein [Methylocella tundrae]VTZ49490.1 conserved hypothetical protein [Methylocella tundrae]
MGVAAQRYWTEVGQHHSGAETTLTNLNRLCNYFGNTMRLDQISDDDVAKLVAWRRAQTARGRKLVRDPQNPKKRIAPPTIAAATVNRSTIEPLQKLFNRAARVWRIPLKNEPDWRKHLLKEPSERVREVRAAEEGAVREAVRRDFLPLVCFARAAGLRLSECLLRKDSVDLAGGRIRTIGKGGKLIDHPITFEMRAILMSEMANPTDYVFTYAAARAKPGKEGHARGARKPITASGLKTMWRRAKNRGGGPSIPADLRFHDLRHDFATKLLRETKNLKLVQKALHHSKIETTTKYAHVLDEEVLAGMEAASRRRLGTSET